MPVVPSLDWVGFLFPSFDGEVFPNSTLRGWNRFVACEGGIILRVLPPVDTEMPLMDHA